VRLSAASRKGNIVKNKILALLAVTAVGSVAVAQSTTQTVTAVVETINDIAVTGTPTLTVTSDGAGNAPKTATDSSSSYAITTNETDKKITVNLDTAMRAETTLTINMSAPSGATSAGTVTLLATPVDAVTGISSLNQSGLEITYTFDATSKAAADSETKTVTFTIADGV
jgi:uncharacterized cupredoxin-like copper-binding protein